MRKLTVLGAIGGVAVLGGAVAATVAATPGSADSFGSCGALSGSGPAPDCSYQVSDGDLAVSFRAAGATASTLTCTVSEGGVIGAVRLSAGQSGTVQVNNIGSGIHSYGVRCSTLTGGRGGVSRAGGFTVSVFPPPTLPTTTTPTFRPPTPTHTRPPRDPLMVTPTYTAPERPNKPPRSTREVPSVTPPTTTPTLTTTTTTTTP